MLRNALFIFGATAIYGGLHSAAASHAAKAWVHRRFGATAARWYRLVYNVAFTMLLLPLLGVPAALPDRILYVIRPPWLYFTTLLQGIGLLIAADATLRTDLPAFLGLKAETPAQDGKLVIRGAYCWMRHPMYTGSLLIIWLMPAMTLNSALFYAALTTYIVIGAQIEERKLLAEYGQSYMLYRQNVPMFIPRFRRCLS